MPYMGSGIMQRNTNAMRSMAQFEMADKRNALANEESAQNIQEGGRKAAMERLWTMGKMLDSVTDEATYENAKGFMKELYGDEVSKKLPEKYDPDWVDRKKAESNIFFEALGVGKEVEVPMTNKDGTRKTKAIYGSKQYLDNLKKGWTQGDLIEKKADPAYKPTNRKQAMKDFEEKEKIKSRYKKTSADKEMTPAEVRKELARMSTVKNKLLKTGGMDDVIFALIAKSDPEMAKRMQQNPDDATKEIDAYMNLLKDLLPKTKKDPLGIFN